MNRRGHVRRGAAAIEMALVLPVMLVLILGMMEWSWLMFQWHTVESSALRGVRLLSGLPEQAEREEAATAAVATHLEAYGVDPADATVVTVVETHPYGDIVRVRVEVMAEPLIGFVLSPRPIAATASAPWFGSLYAEED